jgi:hypothetical protein
MSFSSFRSLPPLRRYLLFRAYGYAVLAIFLAGLPLFIEAADTFGLCFLIGVSAWFALLSYLNFRKARKARDEDRAYGPPVDANFAQQKAYYTKTLGVGAIAFPILTVLTIVSLNSLESGKEASVEVWAPISFLYDFAGYWVAVLFVPLLGILSLGALLWKIRQINEEEKRGIEPKTPFHKGVSSR